MTHRDLHGHALSGAAAHALETFEQALCTLRCGTGDPLTLARRALGQAPAMTMGHVLVAWLHLLGTDRSALADARAAWHAGLALPADEREAMHLRAIGLRIAGRWRDAGATLEDLSVRWPCDLLALQAGHRIDALTGDSRMLRDRIARALPAWCPAMPGYHALLGMHAFGLAETGELARAERHGRRAVELERRDARAWHAVAHVMEMAGRRRDGIAWLRHDSAAWSGDRLLALHNGWHLALFHLGLDEVDEVIALADRCLVGAGSPLVRDLIDASSLLWRLQLHGVDVGGRWTTLAARWRPQLGRSSCAFDDWHATMAFVGAGCEADAERLLAAQAEALAAPGEIAAVRREVGHDLCRAVLAFGRGDHAAAVRLLRPLRRSAHLLGGSHVQRDLIDLTLIEAAARDGQLRLEKALRDERAARH